MAITRLYRSLAFLVSVIPRLLLRNNLKKMVAATASTRTTLIQQLSNAKHYGANTFEALIRVGLYLSIIQLDIKVLNARMVIEIDDEIKDVYARHIALLIHEYLDDLPDLFGGDLRGRISKLPQSVTYIDTMNSIGKELRNIRSNYGSLLYTVRNQVVGHRDHDGEKQLLAIKSLNYGEMEQLAEEIESSISKHIRLITAICLDYSKSRLLLEEVNTKIEQTGTVELPNGFLQDDSQSTESCCQANRLLTRRM